MNFTEVYTRRLPKCLALRRNAARFPWVLVHTPLFLALLAAAPPLLGLRSTLANDARMIRTLDDACLRGARHADTLDRLTRTLTCDRSDPETNLSDLLPLADATAVSSLTDALVHIIRVVGGVLNPIVGNEATAFHFQPSEPGVSVADLRSEFADCFAKRMLARGADYSRLPEARRALGRSTESIVNTRYRFWTQRTSQLLSQVGENSLGRLSGPAFLNLLRSWYDNLSPRCDGTLLPYPEFEARLARIPSQVPVPRPAQFTQTQQPVAALPAALRPVPSECQELNQVHQWLAELQQNQAFWDALRINTVALTSIAVVYEMLATRGIFRSVLPAAGRTMPALATARGILVRGAGRGAAGGPWGMAVGILATLLIEPSNAEAATPGQAFEDDGSMTGHYLAHPERYFELSSGAACRYLRMDPRIENRVHQIHQRLSEIHEQGSTR